MSLRDQVGSPSAASQQEENQIDLTPMLDVVFIMLIFFIVTSSFVKEPGIEIFKPQAATTAGAGPWEIPEPYADQLWHAVAPKGIAPKPMRLDDMPADEASTASIAPTTRAPDQ